MRISVEKHTDQPWRIHEIAPDFRVEDVWNYRTPGAGPDDFPIMLEAIRAQGDPDTAGPLVRLLFAIRWKLGEVFGWDDAAGETAGESLRDRLPADLLEHPGTVDANVPFSPLYELWNEAAMEIVNRTVHGICHLGWIPTDDGDYELRMAVLVKPKGLFGRAYMAAIAPFRYLIVYPAMTRQWERAWREAQLRRGREGVTS